MILHGPSYVWVKLHGPYKDAAPKGAKGKFAVYASTTRELLSHLKQHSKVWDELTNNACEIHIGPTLKNAYNITCEQFLNPHTKLKHGSTIHIVPHVSGGGFALPAWAIIAIVTTAVSIAVDLAMTLLFPTKSKTNKSDSRTSKLLSGGLDSQKEGIPLPYVAGLDVLCGGNIIEASVDYPNAATIYSAKSSYTGGTSPSYGGGAVGSVGGVAPAGRYDASTGLMYADTGAFYSTGVAATIRDMSTLSAEKGGGSSGGNEIPNTLYTDAYARALLALCDGPIGGIVGSTPLAKAKNIFINEVALVDPGSGTYNYQGFTWEERVGSTGQAAVNVTPSIANDRDGGNVQFKHTITGDGIVQYAIGEVSTYDVAKVDIRIRVPALMDTDSNNNQTTTTVSVAVDYKRTTDLAWTPAGSGRYSGKSSSPIILHGMLNAPPLTGEDTWEFRVYRITADSTVDTLQNDTYLDGWNEYYNLDYKYDGTEGTASGVPTALLGVGFDMSQFSQTAYPEIGARVVGRKVRIPANYNPVTRVYATTGTGTSAGVWDGSFQTAATQNPVWHWYHLATSGGTTSPVGLGLPDTWFDKFSLYSVAQFCDEDLSGRPRYTLNKQFTDAEDGWQFLQDLAKTFGSFCYFTGSQVILVADRDQTTPDHYINNTQVEDGLFDYSTTAIGDQINEAIVEWDDPGDYFRKHAIRYRDTDSITQLRSAGVSNSGIVSQTYYKIGCTSEQEAYAFARRLVYSAQNENEIVTFNTLVGAAAYAPGQILAVHDVTVSPTVISGRISSTGSTTVTMDQTFSQLASTAYDLYVVVGNKLSILPISTVSSTTTTATVTPSSMTGISAGLPYGIVEHSTGVQPRLFRIADIQDAGDGKYTITAQFYDRSKYAWVDDDVAAPTITYSDYNSFYHLTAPTGLSVKQQAKQDPLRGTIHNIDVTWDHLAIAETVIRGYTISAKFPDGTIQTVSTGLNTYTFQNAPQGPYQFSVVAVNMKGNPGDAATTGFVLGYGTGSTTAYPPIIVGFA